MKKYFFFLILFVFFKLFPSDDYQINIRNTITNYRQSYPNIDLFLKSSQNDKTGITFYASFYNIEPRYFYLLFDNLKLGITTHSMLIGDRQFLFTDYLSNRGISYKLNFKHIGFHLIAGKTRDKVFSDFPMFNNNINQNALSFNFNFTKNDTTKFHYIVRNDNELYNDYFRKEYLGATHSSTIGKVLKTSLSASLNKNISSSDTLNAAVGNWISNLSLRRFSFYVRGFYIPKDYINFANNHYTKSQLFNSAAASIRITDELSLSTKYHFSIFSTHNEQSYQGYAARINMRIPVLPSITVFAENNRYIQSSIFKDLVWGVNLSKQINAVNLSASYSDIRTEFYKRFNVTGAVMYSFVNASRIGVNYNMSYSSNDMHQRYSGYVRWSPAEFWNMEFGTDLNIRNGGMYISEYIYSTFFFKNIVLSTNLTARFHERIFYQAGFNVSLSNELPEFNLSFIKGKVFLDKNRNDVFDKDEEPVAFIEVILNDTIRIFTDKNGNYSFKFLPKGEYSITLGKSKIPAYYDTRKSYNVTLLNMKTISADIPVRRLSSISGFVFEDYNGNGIKEDNEPGVAGIPIRIKNTDMYTFTNSNGYYIISNLPPGNYIIEIPKLPKIFILSIPDLINYVSIDKVKINYTIDFGILKESKPIRKKTF